MTTEPKRTHKLKKNILALWVASLLATLFMAAPAAAQNNAALLAYENAGGQLVVASADGNFRWIITSPNEQLLPTSNLVWSPNGQQLLHIVRGANGNSLRVAQPQQQAVLEIASINGPLSGGAWLSNNTVIAGTGGGLTVFDTASGNASALFPGASITSGETVSPDGRFVFYAREGQLAVGSSNGGAENLLGTNTANAPGVGLWAQNAPVVAYWTTSANGTTVLGITNAQSGETVAVDTNSAVPVTPQMWLPGTLTLLYRSPVGLMALDASCIQQGCSQVPTPVTVLTATSAQISAASQGSVLVYAANGDIFAVSANCVSAGTCADTAITVGNVSGNSRLHTAGTTAAYTGADNVVRTLDARCANSGSCQPLATGLVGTVAGITANGSFVIVNSGSQLQAYQVGGAPVALGGTRNNSRIALPG